MLGQPYRRRSSSAAGEPEDVPEGPHDPAETALQECIDTIGFGKFQLSHIFLTGSALFADGAILLGMGAISAMVAEEFGISGLLKSMLACSVFTGLLGGTLMAGAWCDKWGRRNFVLLGFSLVFMCSVLCAITPYFWVIVVELLFVGFGIGVGVPASQSLLTEICPTSWRFIVLNGSLFFFPSGVCFSAAILWSISPSLKDFNWRVFLFFEALPSGVMLLVTAIFLYESPHFLLVKKRFEDLTVIIRSIMRWNGVQAAAPHSLFPTGGSPPGGPSSDAPSGGRQSHSSATTAATPRSRPVDLGGDKPLLIGALLMELGAGRKKWKPGPGGELLSSAASSEFGGATVEDEPVPTTYGSTTNSFEEPSSIRTWAKEQRKQLSLLFGRHLFLTTVIMSYLCFVWSFCYYGITYALPETLRALAGKGGNSISAAAQLFLLSSVDLPSQGAAMIIGRHLKRRTSLILACLLGTVSLTLCSLEMQTISLREGTQPEEIFRWFNLSAESNQWLALFTFVMVKVSVQFLVSAAWVYNLEVYPSVCRATGMSMNFVFARLGSILCPLAFDKFTEITGSSFAFYGSMAGLCSAAAILCFFLVHETKDVPLQVSVPEDTPPPVGSAGVLLDEGAEPLVA